MYPYSEKSAIIHLPLQNKRLSTMPNWIEAVIAYLKQNTSLRFNMFWLLSWFALLIFTPIGYIEFINSKLLQWDNPYIVSSLFFVPVSYFISYFVKLFIKLCIYLNRALTQVRLNKKKKNNINNVTDKEASIIAIFAEIGLDSELSFDSMNEEGVIELFNKGIIEPIKGDYINEPKCRYRITRNYLKDIEYALVNNTKIRKAYEEVR